jgi:hypothetical protein
MQRLQATYNVLAMDRIVKQVRGRQFRFGGEEHQGWLPPNAALPKPTPIEESVLDIFIAKEGSGFLLYYKSRNTSHCGDTWHQTLADAEHEARGQFGIKSFEWELIE